MFVIQKLSFLKSSYLRNPVCVIRNFAKDYSSSDDEKPKKPKRVKKSIDVPETPPKDSAATRLSHILNTMQIENNFTIQKSTLSRPGEGKRKRKEMLETEKSKRDIFGASKRVALLLDANDPQRIESELLSKLINREDKRESPQNASDSPQNGSVLSDLIAGMKIDRSNNAKEQSRSDYVRRMLASKQNQQNQNRKTQFSGRHIYPENRTGAPFSSVKLFSSEPLNVFQDDINLHNDMDILTTWSQLNQSDLRLKAAHPPSNYFEKMILWTEKGIVWKFPINNEQGMEQEENVDFSEHVFLEKHLKPWCPTTGPIRHFMELVCVGLSKNPYISAEEKKNHIFWYRDYFENKREMLQDVMVKIDQS